MKRAQTSQEGVRNDRVGMTRRNLLRLTGTTAAIGLVGTAVGTSSVAARASGMCPQTVEFWAFHEWHTGMYDDTYTREVELANVVKTADEWRTFMLTESDDKSHMLAKEVLATRNNLYYRTGNDFSCSNHIPSSFRGTQLEGKTIEQVKNMAVAWLYYSEWAETFDGATQEGWAVTISNRKYDGATIDGQQLYEVLQRFNYNEFDVLKCGCSQPDTIEIASVDTTLPPEEDDSATPLSESPPEWAHGGTGPLPELK